MVIKLTIVLLIYLEGSSTLSCSRNSLLRISKFPFKWKSDGMRAFLLPGQKYGNRKKKLDLAYRKRVDILLYFLYVSKNIYLLSSGLTLHLILGKKLILKRFQAYVSNCKISATVSEPCVTYGILYLILSMDISKLVQILLSSRISACITVHLGIFFSISFDFDVPNWITLCIYKILDIYALVYVSGLIICMHIKEDDWYVNIKQVILLLDFCFPQGTSSCHPALCAAKL